MPLRPITSTPDHPRSRGVYDLGVGTKGIGSGSSPLARGLLSTHAPPRPEPGIIPARAGFTIQIVSQHGLTRDHPRSRGVYQATLRCDVAYGGSSPLARGLRVPIHPDRLERRIIPARAGFTAWPAARSCTSWDHPRSRGVYSSGCLASQRRAGSSPLARGLHGRTWLTVPEGRIIPARAGFTRVVQQDTSVGRDHPRSRGVYVPITLMAIFLFGSSPLARGLPGRLLMIHHGWGIIPARAGFKSTSPPIRPGSTDHPRSRGVYFSHLRPYSSNEGSSPLARGLPKACISITFQPRIIPARAGFT